MSPIKKRRQSKSIARTKQTAKEKFPAFDDLVVEGAVPRVKIRLFPSKGKSRNKPTDHLVVELQCEV